MRQQIIETLTSEQGRILVACHRTPDGDTLGAGLAVFLWLKAFGKDVGIYCADPIPALYRFLPGSEAVTTDQQHARLFVAVDCASADRLSDAGEKLLAQAAVTVNIDHHFTNTRYCQMNLVDDKAGSTAEIVAGMLLENGQCVTPDIADCLYTGIVTDTGQFAFDYTRPESLRTAARLMECGASFEAICARVFRRRTLSKTKLIGTALNSIRLYDSGRVALLSIDQATLKALDATPDECESIVNFAVEIESVEIGVLLRETQTGEWKISLRSSGAADVAAVAKRFGGGGHKKASGCTLAAPRVEAEQKIVAAVLTAIDGI